MDYYLIVVWVTVFLGWFVYKKLTSKFNFFADQGISYEKPLPIFGNLLPLVFQRENALALFGRFYKKYKHEK